ncbi:unnamed protein product [Cuscuta campestris]|uniref:CCHC-type domain-containing protein n=1 Tax=Cuscuta campestris TaxID=132261 RepID=A0A484MKC1_9ASTE|nr:unnamed protein product [Cuscuta campestris]
MFAVKNKMEVKELVCSHCGKTGHEVEACYKLIGYPERWVFRDQAGRGRGNGWGRGHGIAQGGGQSTVAIGHATVTGGRGETSDEDGSNNSSLIDHFNDDDEMLAEEQLDHSMRNGRPEENNNADGIQAVDLVDRLDVHSRPSERQKDGLLGDQPTVDAVDRSVF